MRVSSRSFLPTHAGVAVRVGIGIELLAFSPDKSDAGALAFLIGFTALSCAPYLLTYFLTKMNPTRGAAAAVTALAADTFAFFVLTSIFWTQKLWDGQIVGLTPFVNLLVSIPIAYIGTAIVQKLIAKGRKAA